MKLPKPIERILFVCYGNLCRSVLAEALMKRLLSARGLEHITVGSAGIGALPDYPAPHQIVEVARDRGLDVTGHRSRPLSPSLLDWADIVLIMEFYMGDEISQMRPEKNLDKIFLLGNFALEKTVTGEIDDPFGGSPDSFRQCYDEIEASIQRLYEKLVSEDALAGKTF